MQYLLRTVSVLLISSALVHIFVDVGQINLVAKYGVKTAVYGGKPGVQQQYSGIVGGQSISYVSVDSEIKVRS